MKSKKIFIYVSITILIVITLGVIIAPFLLKSKENFKDDGVVEVWTVSSEKDQFYNSFKEQFVDEFNKQSDVKVKLVTVTPQQSLSADIAMKMEAKGKVPNLFIGNGQDSVFLSNYENDFVSLMDMTEYTDSNVLDSQSYFNDDYLSKEIKPYASLMVNGEALYINKLQMNSFIKFVDENITQFTIADSFKTFFDYDSYTPEKEYFTIDNITDNDILNSFAIKYPVLDETIFDTIEGTIDLSRVMHSLFIEQYSYSFGFDSDVSASQYITFNMVENNFDNWMFNTTNDLNFVDSTIAQDTYSTFIDTYSFLIKEGDMWVRENDNTNPTGPFVNDQLSMFIGANYNAKYVNSDTPDDLQYDESKIIKAPTRVSNDLEHGYVFVKPKTINGLSLGTKEDEVAGDFVDFVLSNLNSDFDFFINEGYLPPITTEENFLEFEAYINDDSNFIDYTDKEMSLLKSLRATADSLIESIDDVNVEIFNIPQLKTTSLFETILFESNRIDNGNDAVDYLISQLNVNT